MGWVMGAFESRGRAWIPFRLPLTEDPPPFLVWCWGGPSIGFDKMGSGLGLVYPLRNPREDHCPGVRRVPGESVGREGFCAFRQSHATCDRKRQVSKSNVFHSSKGFPQYPASISISLPPAFLPYP